MQPPPGAHEEAKRHPNAQVYQIDGEFGPDDAVPPERIMGCWKTDADGRIVGEFIRNPNYRPRTEVDR
ncbi:MAG: hypothetical protein JWQ71_3296 [Pedosphaera sp.]|nr:hypothetical protein [Pedosphaera sp.]